MILAGDIGGTKTLLALFTAAGQCVAKQTYQSRAFPLFSELLENFLSQHNSPALTAVCLGIAGPIVEGDCITTNLPWHLRQAELKAQTGTKQVTLLNDLQATAWGLQALPETDFVALNPAAQNNPGHIAVLAAGTGLGEAIIVRHESASLVLSTEGGHSDFAPVDALEFELLLYLQQKYGRHISYERVVSGMGIADIYDFLAQTAHFQADPTTEARFQTEDKAAVISAQALAGNDPLSLETMRIFIRCYGAEASNLALKTWSDGGVILAGGIAAKNLPLMTDGQFLNAFLDKGRYRDLLKTFPVKICLNSEAALLGAYHYALKHSHL